MTKIDPSLPISTTEEIIEEAFNGHAFVLVDDADRENEGDVIIPAQFATPEKINFMAKYARGLICLAITGERARQLNLPPMVLDNRSGHGTAFTVSIEAREGVTTGISAHDRARTIAVAIDQNHSAEDIVSPGHVFPLVAKEGGVLIRPGHTEAAVDISRIAGLNPSGVICEVMNDDGTMARLNDLVPFSQHHGLKIGTIADLVAYRRLHESYVKPVAETPFESYHGGNFRLIVYRNSIDGAEHIALVRGDISPDQPTLVRMHQVDMMIDMLGMTEAGKPSARSDYIASALKALAAYEGAAVAVFVRDLSLTSISTRVGGGRAKYQDTLAQRDFGVGAQILKDLGVGQMILLTSSHTKLAALEGFGLEVIDRRPIS